MTRDEVTITPKQAYDGDYWRTRAKRTREEAAEAINEDLRRRMHTVAAEYEKLASHADNLRAELERL